MRAGKAAEMKGNGMGLMKPSKSRPALGVLRADDGAPVPGVLLASPETKQRSLKQIQSGFGLD